MYKFLIGWTAVLAGSLTLTLRLGLDRPADLTIDNEQEPRELDPLRASWHHEVRLVTALFEGLVRLNPDKDLAPEPGVAERWEISPDQRTYTFHLRRDAAWANHLRGRVDAVTAHDFVYAWKRVLDPAGDSEYYSLLFLIENAEDYYLGKRYARTPAKDRDRLVAERKLKAAPLISWESVGVKALDDHTLQVRLAGPAPYFLELTAFVTWMPVHRPTVEADRRWDLTPETMVCNGPYVLAERSFNRRIRLERNEAYWNAGRVRSRVVDMIPFDNRTTALLSFEAGYLDYVSKMPDAVARAIDQRVRAGEPHEGFHLHPGFGTYYYRFNCSERIKHPDTGAMVPNPLAKPAVRRALSLAVDRKKMVDGLLGIGRTPSMGLVPTDSIPGYPGIRHDPVRDYDPAAARRMLDQAGLADRKAVPPIVILFNKDELHSHIALFIREAWERELGLTVRVEGMEFKLFTQMTQSLNYIVGRASWFGDYGDPTTFLNLFHSEDGKNQTGWSNAEYDGLLAEARRRPDSKARAEILARAERMLVLEQQPILPLFRYVHAQMIRPSLRGFQQNPRDWMDVSYMYKDPE